jgi:glyoxylase-like metal-dependent hydrolase (beta-lactamase superfamily II)
MLEELGPGAFRLHYESLDFNAGLIVGSGSLLIDTRSSPAEATELQADLVKHDLAPLRMVVNTHHHWDHSFGNQVFSGPVAIYGHPDCRRRLLEGGEEARRSLIEGMPERTREFAEVVITPPDLLIPDRTTLDPGGVQATVRYLGRGHTDNDLVITIGDVLFAGDLVEEGGPPSFDDSYPISWAAVLGQIADSGCEVVVPSHGKVVDRDFVIGMAQQMEEVAKRALDSIGDGRSADEAAVDGLDLPAPVARIAIGRAYSELGAEASPKSR